jgi:mono/diheme cytochrome c family protein
MDAQVEVMPREEFEDWLDEEARAQEAGTSGLGEETFAGACAKCHGLAGEGDIGRRLRGNPLLTDAQAVEVIVRNGRPGRGGNPGMPPVGQDWGERQMEALTDYLEEELSNGG